MIQLGLTALMFIVCYMIGWFVVSLITKRNDIADIAWGLGFIATATFLGIQTGNWHTHAVVVMGLTSLWGIRLAVHIFGRNRKRAEDFRYKQWREEWGKWWVLRSLFQVWLIQGLFMWLISLSAVTAFAAESQPLKWLNSLGILVWIIGFYFEAVGDWQLAQHIKNPKNRGVLMTKGLWRYTRHPNYFGEVTQWWGVWLTIFGLPLAWMAIISPLTISWLILKVSGIPMLEKKYQGRADFEAYAKVTNAFFPWWPKKS
jgi:steroid 5-alpha reductase family enzyme